jgi:hypothetical protein
MIKIIPGRDVDLTIYIPISGLDESTGLTKRSLILGETLHLFSFIGKLAPEPLNCAGNFCPDDK